jgi:hypothetical protein
MESSREILQSSDEALLERIEASPKISEENPCSVHCISPDVLAKSLAPYCEEDEIAAMRLAQQLNIRVPTVLRVIGRWFLMEYVQGVTLQDSWHQIGWFTCIRLAFAILR